ncbi:hypothetical protein RhiirC2_712982 [Rhizophagus irregularis]|uniref:Uncharacterized protein n=1 Tax=Rhizophagus irregularis TaxID=588596 RepID=A0A2N1N543_9GLOM|nr:hypothetical protein RhiirC2_712982 [Rhizophagus irregularis]
MCANVRKISNNVQKCAKLCGMCGNVRKISNDVRKCAENKQRCAEMCRNVQKCAGCAEMCGGAYKIFVFFFEFYQMGRVFFQTLLDQIFIRLSKNDEWIMDGKQ